jgi:hypothetical protein
MARERKTVTIEFIKDLVNRRNKQSTCDAKVREGWNSVLSEVLMAANAYHGFGYLIKAHVPPGEEPGMIAHEDGTKTFPDDTRRYYY